MKNIRGHHRREQVDYNLNRERIAIMRRASRSGEGSKCKAGTVPSLLAVGLLQKTSTTSACGISAILLENFPLS